MEVVEALEDLAGVGADDVLLEGTEGLEQVRDGSAGAELHEDVEVGVGDVDGDVRHCRAAAAAREEGCSAGGAWRGDGCEPMCWCRSFWRRRISCSIAWSCRGGINHSMSSRQVPVEVGSIVLPLLALCCQSRFV